MSDFFEVQSKLEAYPRFRKAPGFEVVRAMLRRIGYEDQIPMIHIVGTNGKGSVASMMTHILVAHGLKVGMFTSPHLVDIRERMTVDNQLMSKTEFVSHYEALMSLIELHMKKGGDRPTFFEVMFLLAVMHFSKSTVDIMVMEAGIGGAHDTTNVLENRWLNVITSISKDHTAILGNTIEAIVKEKAGIVRKNVPTVALIENDEIFGYIKGITDEKMAEFVPIEPFDGIILERDKDSIDFSLDTKYYRYGRLKIVATADYQLTNAKITITAMHELSHHITIDVKLVNEGLAKASWPGRMEYIYSWLLVDGAHNLSGMQCFVDHVNKYEEHRSVDILFACMNDKDYDEMCRCITEIKHLNKVYLPNLPYQRAVDHTTIIERFQSYGFGHVTVVEHLEEFLNNKKDKVGASTLLGAVGSLYLVGEIKKYSGGFGND